MPYQLLWEPHGLTTQFNGHFCCQDALSSISDMCGDLRFDDINYRIIDLRDIEDASITMEELKEIAAYDMAASKINNNKPLKLAIVATTEGVLALSAYYEIEANKIPWQIDVFSSLDSAKHWASSTYGDIQQTQTH